MKHQTRWTILIGLLLALLGAPATSFAHADLLRSDPPQGATLPTPPGAARLWFSEPLDPAFSTAALYDVYGRPVALPGPAHLGTHDRTELALPLPELLGEGTYSIVWSVLSANDGHVSEGMLIFAVGSASPEIPAMPDAGGTPAAGTGLPTTLARAFQYLGALLVTGGLAFGLLVLRPALSSTQAAPLLRRWRQVLLLGHGILLAATITTLLLQAATVGSLGLVEALASDAPARLLVTRWGLLWLARMAGIALLLPLIYFGSPRQLALLWTGLGASAVILASMSLSSHAAALEQGQRETAIVADMVHLAAASLWGGGLLLLGVLLLPGRPADPAWHALAGTLLRAFSAPALAAVPLLLLSGLYSATRHLDQPGSLLSSSYGRLLLAKALLVVLAATLGAYHWRRGIGAVRGRPWSLAAETLLVLLIIGGTAQLVQTPPPARERLAERVPMPVRTPERYQRSEMAGEARLTLEVDAIAVGVRMFTARIEDQQGQPLAADRVLLRVRALDMDMGVQSAQMVKRQPGVFEAQLGAISMRGLWEARLIVRRLGQADLGATFQIDVR